MSAATDQQRQRAEEDQKGCVAPAVLQLGHGERVQVVLAAVVGFVAPWDHQDGVDRAEQHHQHAQAVLDIHHLVQVARGEDRVAHERGHRE